MVLLQDKIATNENDKQVHNQRTLYTIEDIKTTKNVPDSNKMFHFLQDTIKKNQKRIQAPGQTSTRKALMCTVQRPL